MSSGNPRLRRVGVSAEAESRHGDNSRRPNGGQHKGIYPSLEESPDENAPQFQVLLRVPSEEGGGVINEGYKVDEEPNIDSPNLPSPIPAPPHPSPISSPHPHSPRPSPRLSPRLMAENMKRKFSEAIHHKPDNVVFMVSISKKKITNKVFKFSLII